jgi:tRNA (guanine-N7-)-methyltransferase
MADNKAASQPVSDEAPQNKRILYGRRQGHKLHPRQQQLVEARLPELQPDLTAPQAPADWFDSPKTGYHLEVGFGGGEHVAARAKAAPDIGFIACEPFINGVAKLLIEIDENALHNIAVHNDDARDVMAALPDACLAQAYLLYPDPWPKKRHHKRRFISAENLDQLFRILKPGAGFLVASDIADYLNWTLIHMRAHGGFDWQAKTAADWQATPEGWPGTRYEAKAIREGRVPGYLRFTRRAARQEGQL